MARKSEFRLLGKFVDNNYIRVKNAANEQQIISEIIDYNGKYYKLIPERVHNAWLAPLSGIVNFVTVDCKVSQGEFLKMKDLAILSKNWKDINGKFFRGYFKDQDSEIILNEVNFRALWEHSYINLPESEWGEEIV